MGSRDAIPRPTALMPLLTLLLSPEMKAQSAAHQKSFLDKSLPGRTPIDNHPSVLKIGVMP
jgi:hypothetical protein